MQPVSSGHWESRVLEAAKTMNSSLTQTPTQVVEDKTKKKHVMDFIQSIKETFCT